MAVMTVPVLVAKVNLRASLIVQLVKNLPAVQETRAQLLGEKDLLEKG